MFLDVLQLFLQLLNIIRANIFGSGIIYSIGITCIIIDGIIGFYVSLIIVFIVVVVIIIIIIIIMNIVMLYSLY